MIKKTEKGKTRYRRVRLTNGNNTIRLERTLFGFLLFLQVRSIALKKNLLILFAAAVAVSVSAQTLTIKIASMAPSRSVWDVEQRKLGQEWARISNGTVIVNFQDAAAHGGEEDVILKLRSPRPGQKPPLDGAVFSNIGVSLLAPKSKVLTFCAPFVFRNQDEVNYVLGRAAPQFEKALKDEGFVLLGWFSVGWIHFMTKEEARTPEKLKTLTLALGGINSTEITNTFKMAGFKTENVPADKLPQSIKSKGGVQGMYSVPLFGYVTRFYENLTYILDVPICPVFSAFVLSESVWNQVPAQYKPAMIEALRKAEKAFIDVQKETDRSTLDLMAKNGATLVKLTDAELAVWERVFADDVQRVSETGRSVIDKDLLAQTKKLLEEYRAANKSVRN
jgi:TRAP-type C4-dicarboxylate transport system substrate-binding protein